MLKQGDLLTLENDKEYAVVDTTKINDIIYVYLINSNDYSDFMFCSYDQIDGLYEVEDSDVLSNLIEVFNYQLNGDINGTR